MGWETLLLLVTYFPTNLIYPFTLRLKLKHFYLNTKGFV